MWKSTARKLQVLCCSCVLCRNIWCNMECIFYGILVSLNFILWALGWYTENAVGAFPPPCLYGWPSDQGPLLSILQTTSGAYFTLCSRQLLSIDQHWNKTHAYESLRIATNYLKSLSHTHTEALEETTFPPLPPWRQFTQGPFWWFLEIRHIYLTQCEQFEDIFTSSL